MPTSRRKCARQDILLVLDGAPNHRCGDLVVLASIMLPYLPPYSPELNPKENLWDEIRDKGPPAMWLEFVRRDLQRCEAI